MKITNNHNAPKLVVDMVRQLQSEYSRGDADISVTSLIGSPLISILRDQHRDELEDDVSDLMLMAYGTAMHKPFEALKEDYIKYQEQRMFIELDGFVISGQFDIIYEDRGKLLLDDIKFTTKSVMEEEPKKEWVRQLNIYKYMVESMIEPKLKIDGLGIIAMARNAIMIDTVKSRRLTVPVFKKEKVLEYIKKQIAFHKLCRDPITKIVPECLPADRWNEPAMYAAMKVGGKKAIKRYLSEDEAEARVEKLKKDAKKDEDYYVEYRPEINKRCNTCNVSKWCWWWKLDPNDRPNSYEVKT